MIKSKVNTLSLAGIFCCALLFLFSCHHDDAKSAAKGKYSFYVLTMDARHYLIQTDSLSAGHINSPLQGIPVEYPGLFYDLIVKDNSYYWYNSSRKAFVRHELIDQSFKETSSIPMKGIDFVENYLWVNEETLMIIGTTEKDGTVKYALIHTKDMTAKEGLLPVPPPASPFNTTSVGFSTLMNGKLLVGYTYHMILPGNSYSTSDTMYIEEISYPEFTPVSRTKTTKSTYPGGVNTRQPHSFTDEKGDFYFIACPGIATGNHPDKPTGIFRINKSTGQLDPDFFFNVSASPIQNHGYGFWYMGNGKAIVRTERKGYFTGMKDHYKIHHFDFYVLDLHTQTVRRLELPLDKGTARQAILIENGLVYITINPLTGPNAVWIYNPETEELKEGLTFDETTDFIVRMERLN